jgi:glycosyltransferase involved in cell wall biosynthesis
MSIAAQMVNVDTAVTASFKRITILNNMVTPYTNRLYNRLVREGVPLSVVSCSVQEANRSWGDNDPAQYPHTVLAGRSLHLGPGRYAHVNSGVGAALSRTRPDFLFINGFYPTMLIGAAWALLHRKPMGLITEGWRETMPNSLAHRIVRPLVIGRCRAVITPGRKGAAYFRSAGVAAKNIHRVPLVPAWDIPERVPSFGERDYHLLWCAHLNDTQKNVSFFLDVVDALKLRLPDLHVRVVGKGELEDKLLIRLKAAGVAFRHEPSVSWHKMADVYASARVFVLPSRWEPWGLVCDEAIQCGVPTLVSRHVGAGDDVVVSGSNGYVLPLDIDTWVDRALTLATDAREWSAFSERARASAACRGLESATRAFIAMANRL